jgi:hypothetical protein
MDTSLLFSKLAPHLDNLAPNAIHLILGTRTPSGADAASPIAACVWIPATRLNALDSWMSLSGEFAVLAAEIDTQSCIGYSSVLITTEHAPGSPAHRLLTKEIRGIVKQRHRPRSTIILISTSTYLSNLNTYINLARLFSKSPWALLVPPELNPALPTERFSDVVSQMGLRVQTVDSGSLFKASGDKERPYMDGLLVPQDSPIWCPEQHSAALSGREWSECIRLFLLYHGDELGKAQEPEQTSGNDQ